VTPFSIKSIHVNLKTIALLLLISCTIAAIPRVSRAADPFIGNIRFIDSDAASHKAMIVRTGKTAGVAAIIGDAVFAGDTINTDKGVKVQVELADSSVVNIAPESSLQMKSYEVDVARSRRNAVFKTFSGTVRFVIGKIFKSKASGATTTWKDSDIKLETTTAIAGIKGTDVILTVSAVEVEIAVLDGVVGVRNIDPKIAGEVVLIAHQLSRVIRNAMPAAPAFLTQLRRDQLLKHSTPSNVLKSTGRARPFSRKKDKQDESGIAKELASGVPLKDIMKEAVKEGMDINVFVAEAIAQGVDPGLVVYTAVAAGNDPRAIVAVSLMEGAPLATVVNAAEGAGASKKDIYTGASLAGAPPAAVADAISATSAPGAPVYGSPVDTQPAVYTPPATVPVSGGGGATPSTQPASPFKPDVP